MVGTRCLNPITRLAGIQNQGIPVQTIIGGAVVIKNFSAADPSNGVEMTL